MPQHDLEIRVEFLEKTVAGLAGLPQQVQSLATQILQFREEVSADISGVKAELGELRGSHDELRGELHGVRDELRGEMHGIRDELRGEMRGMHDEMVGRINSCRGELVDRIDSCRDELRADMAAMHRELAGAILASQTQTLTLHEHLVEQIALLGEGLRTKAGTPPPDDAR